MSVAIIGAGAWGTALAEVAVRAGNQVTLFGRDQQQMAAINQTHENKQYLPGIKLSPHIKATSDLADIYDADILMLVVPAQQTRDIYQQIVGKIKGKLVLCSKGIEQDSLMLLSEVISDVAPYQDLAVLSGPNFAKEIVRNLPAASVVASVTAGVAEYIAQALCSYHFRLYASHDIIGLQIAGAVKNVLAIACGILAGFKLGENAKAALISRGLAEMQRLCIAKGGQAKTLIGLAGVGDLLLTCGSSASRNFSLGLALTEGKKAQEVLDNNNFLAEGVKSALSVNGLCLQQQIEMPICQAVYQILYHEADVFNTIENLLARKTMYE